MPLPLECCALVTLVFPPFLHLSSFLPLGLCTCCPLSSERSSFPHPSDLSSDFTPQRLDWAPVSHSLYVTYPLWASASSSIKWRQQECPPSRTVATITWVHIIKCSGWCLACKTYSQVIAFLAFGSPHCAPTQSGLDKE